MPERNDLECSVAVVGFLCVFACENTWPEQSENVCYLTARLLDREAFCFFFLCSQARSIGGTALKHVQFAKSNEARHARMLRIFSAESAGFASGMVDPVKREHSVAHEFVFLIRGRHALTP